MVFTSDREVTEGFYQDYNKRKIIDRKDEASYAIGLAEAMPTIEFVRAAYGKLNTFASLLTHDGFEINKKVLEEKRSQLKDMGMLLNGCADSYKLKTLQNKYKVYPHTIKKGVKSTHETILTNLPSFVQVMREICTDLIEYTQVIGFGSARAMPKKRGINNAFDMAGLDPQDAGA